MSSLEPNKETASYGKFEVNSSLFSFPIYLSYELLILSNFINYTSFQKYSDAELTPWKIPGGLFHPHSA